MAHLDKRAEFEGDPYSKIVQSMRKFGRNVSSTLTLGTITGAPPEIKLQIDNDPIEYDKHDIFVAERLTRHKRAANVSGIGVAEIEYTDELAVGDRVLVECDDENMRYTIVDRAVSYA